MKYAGTFELRKNKLILYDLNIINKVKALGSTNI